MAKRKRRYESPRHTTHNRQTQVMLAPHEDCRACAAMQEKLEQQIVANAILRSEVIDLRQAAPRRQTIYGPEDIDTSDLPLSPTKCEHGRALLGYCARCERDRTALAWYDIHEPYEEQIPEEGPNEF